MHLIKTSIIHLHHPRLTAINVSLIMGEKCLTDDDGKAAADSLDFML